jgi:hypothetical protein
VAQGTGEFSDGRFSCSACGPYRLELTVDADHLTCGADPTMISVRNVPHPFTFFLRDVDKEYPIFIPDYGVAATTGDDGRSYREIEEAIRSKRLVSALQRIDMEQEESYETAAANTLELRSPIWLGITRDVRIFELGLRQPMLYTDYIQPRFHGHGYFWPEKEYV